jgi:CHAT domain-containing protein
LTDFADFEISLRRRDGTNYSVETRYTPPGSDADIRSDKPMSATFDLEALQVMIVDPVEYGKMLAESLFADPNFKTTFSDARKSAQSQQVSLRVRLLVGLSAPELNTVYWEALRDPDDHLTLFTSENILFSRYLSSSDWRPVKLRPQGTLRALVAVSNPSNLENYKLAPVDVAGEVSRAKETFGSVPVTALGDDENCTLNMIMKKLREGYDILYLAAHGTVVPNKELGINEPRIWLQAEDGTAAITPASEVVARMKELQQQPRLVVLASCQSAGKGNGNVLQAFGPQLAQAGVPAVIAMQGNISMESVKKFMPTFFDELQKDGQIDRALTVARGTIREAHDFWMPVLFMRLRSGKIWYVPGVGDEGEFEKWTAILNGINSKTCTPILGPNLYEPMIGYWRDMAAHMAEEYGFPLSNYYRDALPQVTQYLSVTQDPTTLNDTFTKNIRTSIQSRWGDDLSNDMKKPNVDVQALISFIGKKLREIDPFEQHKVLASLKLPIYVTTNYDNLMEDALKELGLKPKMEICPWSDRFYVDEPSVFEDGTYTPSPDEPLVYHLFGHFKYPDSMVLTEDDYFEFLRGATSNKDLIPSKVRSGLTKAVTLYTGFQLDDWAFRILFRAMMNPESAKIRERFSHVGVQVDLDETRFINPRRARKYLESYFGASKISIFWGNSADFLAELSRRYQPVA